VPRILIVDDEPLISMMMGDWLAELGCQVVGPAQSIKEGLDLAGKSDLDGAILDLHLNGDKSYDIAMALRERGVPFAFATGDGHIDPAAGFPNPILLPKPFDFNAVKIVVGKLLRPAAGAA
jgi:DNA-binding response OmpR family regulator